MWESTEKVYENSKTGNMITNHTNRYKTVSRVGYLGSSIPSGKPCQNRILFMNLLMDRGTHEAGSQAGLGGEGTIHCDHLWLHKIQTIGKYLTQERASLCMLLRPSKGLEQESGVD